MAKRKKKTDPVATVPLKLADLKPAQYNPRDITPHQLKGLKKSIAEFGDLSGIVFNQRTGRLVAGHQRVRALREKYGELDVVDGQILTPGGEAFRVRVVDWPEDKEKLANITANNPGIQGSFDETLSDLIAELQGGDFAKMLDELNLDALTNDLETFGLDTSAGVELEPARETVVRILIAVTGSKEIEQAIQQTGLKNRGEALAEICREYLQGQLA